MLKFDPVNKRMCMLRVKAMFFDMTLFCVYVQIEEADEAKKEEFYYQLEQAQQSPKT